MTRWCTRSPGVPEGTTPRCSHCSSGGAAIDSGSFGSSRSRGWPNPVRASVQPDRHARHVTSVRTDSFPLGRPLLTTYPCLHDPAERGRVGPQSVWARAWRDAREGYQLASARTALEAEDLERFARTTLLTGDDEAYVDGLAQASRAWTSRVSCRARRNVLLCRDEPGLPR